VLSSTSLFTHHNYVIKTQYCNRKLVNNNNFRKRLINDQQYFKIFKQPDKSGNLTSWNVQSLETKLEARKLSIRRTNRRIHPHRNPRSIEGRRVLSRARKKGTKGCRKDAVEREEKGREASIPVCRSEMNDRGRIKQSIRENKSHN